MATYSRYFDFRKPDEVQIDDFLSRGSCHNRQEAYLDRMQRLLGAYPNTGVPHEPSKIYSGVFLGTTADAENTRLLHRMGITHIINCSAPHRSMEVRGMRKPSVVRDGIIGYMGLDIEDSETYNIRSHFPIVSKYIKSLRKTGGKVIVVGSGVSAASTLVIAYLMQVKRKCLLEAAQLVKSSRTVALTNINFMCQLVEVAEEEELFDHHVEKMKIPQFGRGLDRSRLYSAHLPDVSLISSRPYTLFTPKIKPREEYTSTLYPSNRDRRRRKYTD